MEAFSSSFFLLYPNTDTQWLDLLSSESLSQVFGENYNL